MKIKHITAALGLAVIPVVALGASTASAGRGPVCENDEAPVCEEPPRPIRITIVDPNGTGFVN